MERWGTKEVVAAIDFGTTFSGYAISIYKDYEQAGGSDKRLRLLTSTWTDTAMRSVRRGFVLFNHPLQ